MDFRDDVADYSLSQFNDFEKDLQIWADRFYEFKNAMKVSEKTKDSYKEALTSFFTFCKIYNKQMNMSKISARFINRYILWYQEEIAKSAVKKHPKNQYYLDLIIKQNKSKNFGKNDAIFEIFEPFENTISQRITILKSYLKFITENNKELKDYVTLFDKISQVKIRKKLTHYLTQNELKKVIAEMVKWPETYKGPNRKPKSSLRYAYRDSLLIMLYCMTGARGEELVLVKQEDVRLEDGQYIIDILHGKGGSVRSLKLSKQESKKIKKHMQYLHRELPHNSSYLSATYNAKELVYTNKPMSADSIRRFGNFVFKLLNINKSGLHTIRRGYATCKLTYDKIDIATIAKRLGNTTAILEKHYYKDAISEV